MRAGWTLHETLISLVIMGLVMALAAQLATGHLRFFRSSAELARVRRDAAQASSIAAAVLRGIAPAEGDLLVAMDSAIEVSMPIGAALSCGMAGGALVIPASSGPTGNTLAAFSDLPQPGDRVFALRLDSTGAAWSAHTIADADAGPAPCAAFSGTAVSKVLRLADTTTFPAATPLRFARPFRLSLYRGGDGRWYLGARDWNSGTRRFNTVQPVAGPLLAYDPDPARSGLAFRYRSPAGATLSEPIATTAVGMITIVARAASGTLADSSTVTVSLRSP